MVGWYMQVAVIGSGAMGAIFGIALARSGDDVMFLDSRSELIAAIERDGFVLEGALGFFHLHPRAALEPGSFGAVDCALVMVDASATPEAARVAASCLAKDGFVLTLQNGIGNVEVLGEAVGLERVVAGSTYNSGTSLGLGRVLHSNVGPTWIGEAVGGTSQRAGDLAKRLTCVGLPTTVSENIMGVVWSKFVHNCAINPVSAITGLRPGEIARDPAAAEIMAALLDEILAVVSRAGIELSEHSSRAEIYDHAWERYNRPSMLQHLEAGRQTEIEALNGAVVRSAKSLGIPTPVNETIVAIVKAIEAQRRLRVINPTVDEATMEAAARADARKGRWGAKAG
jgi:2-dehydropantoate 2-reductase